MKLRRDSPSSKKRRKLIRIEHKEAYSLTRKAWENKYRDLLNQKQAIREKANPSKYRQYDLNRYGITIEQWEGLFEIQGRKCAICETPVPGRRGWHTDHDHKTQVVRGILCSHCNSILGFAKDDIRTLVRATAYLTRMAAQMESFYESKCTLDQSPFQQETSPSQHV